MNFYEENIIKQEILNDINTSFKSFLVKSEPKEINAIWANLSYASNKGWFNKDLYEYWLTKFLNLPHNEASYILGITAITEDVCGFDQKELGEYLATKIDFYYELNDFGRIINWVNCAHQGNAFFEKAWLRNILDKILDKVSIDKTNIIETNNMNEALYLNIKLKK